MNVCFAKEIKNKSTCHGRSRSEKQPPELHTMRSNVNNVDWQSTEIWANA